MAQLTIVEACNRITTLTADVALHTRDWPRALPPEELQKYVGTLALAVSRLNVCVKSLAEGKEARARLFERREAAKVGSWTAASPSRQFRP